VPTGPAATAFTRTAPFIASGEHALLTLAIAAFVAA
jgi:hypothetical protein